MKILSLNGLIAATHTPFHADGSLNLAAVERQAAHLQGQGVETVFIGGSTGECHSLMLRERQQLAQRWADVTQGSRMRVVVHVGGNCLEDGRALAAQAAQLGALAISAVAPSYFKPGDVSTLVSCCAAIAAAAPETPFYFYHIPSLTGVQLSMPEFLERAQDKIATLGGLKFSHADLMAFQLCLRAGGCGWDVLWGIDEALLGALALGARGAVGSTYNFAAPLYHRLRRAFAAGDLDAAREEQFRSVRLVQTLARHGFMGAAKALMNWLDVPVGPARLPHLNLAPNQLQDLRGELEAIGFFSWARP